MSNEYIYEPCLSEGDAAEYARVLAHAFGRPEKDTATWIAKLGRPATRVLKRDGAVAAGLIEIEMGQFFGGRSVPMTGIAAVGTAPEHRGQGVALEMMKRCVLEMHEAGVPISGLYPATQRLYRLAGWEQSGHRCEIRIPLARIGVRERELAVRPMREEDRDAVRAVYQRVAQDGNLDRTALIWDRIERPPLSREDLARAFVVDGNDGIEGYVYLTQAGGVPTPRGQHEVTVHDMNAGTARGARRLWAFLSSYATMAVEMAWFAGPGHPMLMMLSEQPYRVSGQFHWMTRMVNVKSALEARGYGAGLKGVVAFEVRDELVESNNGVFVLEVADGRGTVTRGSTKAATVRTTVNGMAAMFTGYMPARALRSVGIVEGDDEAVGMASSVFAGGTPWMTDMF